MSRFERWSVWVTSTITAITGIGLLWTKYFIQTSDPWAVVNSPLQPWLLRSHLVVSPLLVFAIGLITTRHIWRHLRTRVRIGRRTGVAMGFVLFPMIVSGYLIQVTTDRAWLTAIIVAHIATGLVYCAGIVLHQIAIRPWRRSAEELRAAGEPAGPEPLGGIVRPFPALSRMLLKRWRRVGPGTARKATHGNGR